MAKLTRLELSGCPLITSDLQKHSVICQNLEVLKLACCPHLDRNAVLVIPLQHPTLRILNLTCTIRIEAEEAGKILRYRNQLLVCAVTPAYVVCEKVEWLSLLTVFHNLGF